MCLILSYMATKSTTKSKSKSKKPKTAKKPKAETESYDDLYKKVSDLESKIEEIEKTMSLGS